MFCRYNRYIHNNLVLLWVRSETFFFLAQDFTRSGTLNVVILSRQRKHRSLNIQGRFLFRHKLYRVVFEQTTLYKCASKIYGSCCSSLHVPLGEALWNAINQPRSCKFSLIIISASSLFFCNLLKGRLNIHAHVSTMKIIAHADSNLKICLGNFLFSKRRITDWHVHPI